MLDPYFMMGMGVSGACGAMGTHSCGTGDCVMGSPFSLTCVFPAFSLPKWLGKSTKQNKHTKRGLMMREKKSVKKVFLMVPAACRIAVLKCLQTLSAYIHKPLYHWSTGRSLTLALCSYRTMWCLSKWTNRGMMGWQAREPVCQRVFIVGSGTKMRMGASEGVLPEVDPASSTAPKVCLFQPWRGERSEGEKGSDCFSGRHWSIVSAVCSFSRPLTCIVVRLFVQRAATAGRTAGGWWTAGTKLVREREQGGKEKVGEGVNQNSGGEQGLILECPLSLSSCGSAGHWNDA